jgi:hypothetical protein
MVDERCSSMLIEAAYFISSLTNPRKKEIEILEAELGIDKDAKDDEAKSNDDHAGHSNNFGLEEPTMISIPQLPRPYQPGGGGTPSNGGVGSINFLSNVDEMLATEFTPPDRYFTVSAVLGRLKDPMKLPLPPNSQLGAVAALGGEETEQMRKRRKMMLDKQQVRQHENLILEGMPF